MIIWYMGQRKLKFMSFLFMVFLETSFHFILQVVGNMKGYFSRILQCCEIFIVQQLTSFLTTCSINEDPST